MAKPEPRQLMAIPHKKRPRLFIAGRDFVLVTDPGGSLTDGEKLRASIAETTSLPVKYVVMSRVHPDHFFGASAFLKDDPVFIGRIIELTAHAPPRSISAWSRISIPGETTVPVCAAPNRLFNFSR